MGTQIKQFAAKGIEASQLRRRKYELVREFGLPESLLGDALSKTHRRCGKSNCRCAEGKGHPQWTVVARHQDGRRREHIPRDWLPAITEVVAETEAYLEAVREVMAINLELLRQTRLQRRRR